MIDLRVFPRPEQQAIIADLYEWIARLEAELAEIRQHPLVYVTYNPESKTDLEKLRQQISELVDRSTAL